MKLTWFGGTTIRIHIGGEVLVLDADQPPAGIDRSELVSGADRILAISDAFPAVDPAAWRPRSIGRAIDGTGAPPVRVVRIGASSILIDATGESPLVLVTGAPPPRPGRWAGAAVVVLFEPTGPDAITVLDGFQPRLIALAASEATIGAVIADLRDRLEETGLVALEPGMALEI